MVGLGIEPHILGRAVLVGKVAGQTELISARQGIPCRVLRVLNNFCPLSERCTELAGPFSL